MVASNNQNKFYWHFQAKWILMWTGTKQFILRCFVTGYLTLLEKINGIQTNAGHANTEYTLKTNLACIFL